MTYDIIFASLGLSHYFAFISILYYLILSAIIFKTCFFKDVNI